MKIMREVNLIEWNDIKSEECVVKLEPIDFVACVDEPWFEGAVNESEAASDREDFESKPISKFADHESFRVSSEMLRIIIITTPIFCRTRNPTWKFKNTLMTMPIRPTVM